MKKIQIIILAFMLGIVPIQAVYSYDDFDTDMMILDGARDNLLNELNALNKKLKEYGSDSHQFILAVERGELEKVKSLTEKGIDVNATKNNLTPLMRTAFKGHLDIVKYLISKGANVNAKSDKYGFTALMMTAGKGYLEVVKYLISKGADINDKDKNGTTALMYASKNGHLEVVKYLINKGADMNAKDNYGGTALIMASSQGYLEVVKSLIKGKSGLLSIFSKGADVNVVVSTKIKGVMYNLTALDVAKNNEIAEVLRKAGAKSVTEIKNKE